MALVTIDTAVDLQYSGVENNIVELVKFVQEVSENDSCTFQEACRALKDAYRLARMFRTLTSRERDIAILAAWGASVAETAAKLFITSSTVQSHRHRIRRKLGIPTGSHLNTYLSKAFYKCEA